MYVCVCVCVFVTRVDNNEQKVDGQVVLNMFVTSLMYA